MTMRKKDYEAIARAMRLEVHAWQDSRGTTRYDEAECDGAERALSDMAEALADYCATQDPTFKRDRFLADCGVSQS